MAKKDKECLDAQSCRMGKVGGQAVLEGVMMKAGTKTVTTCRKEDGTMVVTDSSFVSVRKKHKILNIPILRGIINMVEMLKLSMDTLTVSAEALGLEEEEETKFERWLKKHFGANLIDFLMVIAMVLGVALAIGLFIVLPVLAAGGISWLIDHFFSVDIGVWEKVIEGVMKAIIFVAYLAAVSLMPDIRRTFMYHGAEHKTIACYEAGDELTPENAMKHRRFHPRCGTSFMFLMIILGILAGVAVDLIFPDLLKWQYILIKFAILPLIVGVGYEFIMIAGKHDNFVTRFFSAPGLWVQRLTTKEPTLDMLEVAICSTKCALRDADPEFMEFYRETMERQRAAAAANAAAEAEGECEQACDTDAASADSSEPAIQSDADNDVNTDTAADGERAEQ